MDRYAHVHVDTQYTVNCDDGDDDDNNGDGDSNRLVHNMVDGDWLNGVPDDDIRHR